MRVDWKHVAFLAGIIVLCIIVCVVLWGSVWINEQLWIHVSPLASWVCAFVEVFIAVLCFSIRKKKQVTS